VYLAARSAAVPYLELILIVAFAVAGTILTRPCEEDLRCIDPGPIVIDEVMGMLITLFMIPVGWGGILLGFLLFRALDVLKPFPARQLERLHGGFGVMADDAMAAIYAHILLRGAYYLVPGWIS
jgi:phosphatidylglycerophosphatase A